jgi:hypothetical protein
VRLFYKSSNGVAEAPEAHKDPAKDLDIILSFGFP